MADPNQQHPLERRASLLAARFAERVGLMANLMRPDGRAIFHQRVPESQALQFWRRHRYDDVGKQVLSTWGPDQIIQLDQRLMQANESSNAGMG